MSEPRSFRNEASAKVFTVFFVCADRELLTQFSLSIFDSEIIKDGLNILTMNWDIRG